MVDNFVGYVPLNMIDFIYIVSPARQEYLSKSTVTLSRWDSPLIVNNENRIQAQSFGIGNADKNYLRLSG